MTSVGTLYIVPKLLQIPVCKSVLHNSAINWGFLFRMSKDLDPLCKLDLDL